MTFRDSAVTADSFSNRYHATSEVTSQNTENLAGTLSTLQFSQQPAVSLFTF